MNTLIYLLAILVSLNLLALGLSVLLLTHRVDVLERRAAGSCGT